MLFTKNRLKAYFLLYWTVWKIIEKYFLKIVLEQLAGWLNLRGLVLMEGGLFTVQDKFFNLFEHTYLFPLLRKERCNNNKQKVGITANWLISSEVLKDVLTPEESVYWLEINQLLNVPVQWRRDVGILTSPLPSLSSPFSSPHLLPAPYYWVGWERGP